MLKRSLVLLSIVLASTVLLHSHGAALVGTVTAVSGDKVTVKPPTGTSTDVMITKDTLFIKEGKKTTRVDLKVGSRVTIDSMTDAKTKALVAESIEIGTAVATAPTKPAVASTPSTASKTTSTASKTTGTPAKAPASTSTQSKSATGTAGTKE